MGSRPGPTDPRGVYAAGFYEDQSDGSLRSARVVAPSLIELVRPRSVLDVGCGVGTWLRAFVDRGVTDVVGLDGHHVEESLLRVDPALLRPTDLSQPFDLGRRFHLVLCLEVAEHLDAGAADTLVRSLAGHGDVIAFSAAVPFQGGTHHVNEQWPAYWMERFEAHGYACLDVLRPMLWDRPEVEWWYAQNLFLFVAEDELADPRWATVRALPTFGKIAAVHPRLHEARHQPPPATAGPAPGAQSGRPLLHRLLDGLGRAGRRIARRGSSPPAP